MNARFFWPSGSVMQRARVTGQPQRKSGRQSQWSQDEVNSRGFIDLFVSVTDFSAFFENIIVDRINRPKGLASHLRVRHAHAEGLFHTDRQFQGVDRVQSEAVWPEKRQIVPDL